MNADSKPSGPEKFMCARRAAEYIQRRLQDFLLEEREFPVLISVAGARGKVKKSLLHILMSKIESIAVQNAAYLEDNGPNFQNLDKKFLIINEIDHIRVDLVEYGQRTADFIVYVRTTERMQDIRGRIDVLLDTTPGHG